MGKRRKKKETSTAFVIFLIVLIIIFIVWGYLGEKYVQEKEIVCDIGVFNKFCWSWSSGRMEKFEQNIRDYSSEKIQEILNMS